VRSWARSQSANELLFRVYCRLILLIGIGKKINFLDPRTAFDAASVHAASRTCMIRMFNAEQEMVQKVVYFYLYLFPNVTGKTSKGE
jgi:hypothetical protein